MKSLFKILYVGLAFIMAIFIYMLGYNSNGYAYIQTLTGNAIKEANYSEVAKIHGGCFYSESIVTDESDKFDLAIFPSATLSTYTYYSSSDLDAEATTDYLYENSYYIYVFKPTYEYDNLSVGDTFNNTAIRFNSANGSYNYLLNVTDAINTDHLSTQPLSLNDSALKASRNAISSYSSWEFFNITLTATMIEAMQSELKGAITSVTLVDSEGKDVDTVAVELNFDHQFFTDVEPLAVKYNEYIKEFNAADQAKDKDGVKAAEEKFNAFYEGDGSTKGFKDKFFEINSKNSFRHDDDYLRPGKLVWQSIGMIVLFVVCAALLYVLLFHFNFIKSIVFKDRSGNYRKAPGAYSKKANSINAKVEPVNKNTKANNKPASAPVEKPAPVVEEAKVAEEPVVAQEAKEEAKVDTPVEEVEASTEEKTNIEE